MPLNYKYQLEPLRTWFLTESPKEAVISFREMCETLLDTPDSFMENIMNEEFIKKMNGYMNEINKSNDQLEKIVNFLEHNHDEEEGYTAFEYLLVRKHNVSQESVGFIRSQYNFFLDIHAISDQVKRNNEESEFEAYKDQVKEILKSSCAKKNEMCSYLNDYATFMSELESVTEANEKYPEVQELDQEGFESFLMNGVQIIDNYRKIKEEEAKKSNSEM
ncbi:MAG: hypothetical protein MJZ19_05280 [Paludibacteraceae bacterium]|nr:hypothetical protein [Paludibacteraceae bacterium]MCQ2327676.1 hypothetical protein [Bacteroidales bacterium]